MYGNFTLLAAVAPLRCRSSLDYANLKTWNQIKEKQLGIEETLSNNCKLETLISFLFLGDHPAAAPAFRL